MKQVLLPQLQLALDLYLLNQELLHIQPKLNISWYKKKDYRITYVWAIALQLSSVQKLPAMQIATRMMHFINTASVSHATPQTKLATEIAATSTLIATQVVPPGLIYLELTDVAIATWLQYLTLYPPKLEKYDLQKNSNPSVPFVIQYTHARCCSLLHLAAREGLITLEPQLEYDKGVFFVASDPKPIPFLDFQQKLLCNHPSEQALIRQLWVSLDKLYCHSIECRKTQWEKIALDLSQAWQNFYTYCRIWGEVKQDNLRLAQARLGLILLTQSLLSVLLNDKLEIYAPTQL